MSLGERGKRAGSAREQIVEGLVSHGRTWAFTPREMGTLDHCEQRGRGLTQCSQAPSGGCYGKDTVGVGSRGDPDGLGELWWG